MIEDFNKINTVEELYNFLDNNISYGYLGNSGRIYHFDDADFNDNWKEEYILEDKDDLLRTGYGNCWDQVELERAWFRKHNYEYKTIFEMVLLDYDNNYPSHTFLIYKDGDNWYWFEHADFDNRGIHKYISIEELINDQYSKYLDLLKKNNITNEEISKIILTEYDEPNKNVNSEEFLEHVINSKRIYVK
jgi:hypothetical protein